MNKPDDIQISVSQESVQSIINAHIHAAVTKALLPQGEKLVAELVERSLFRKDIEANRYRNEQQKVTFLEDLVQRIIAEEAEKGIKAWAEAHRDKIAEQIQKAIAAKRFGEGWAMQIVEAMLGANQYNFKVEVQPVRR